MAKKFVLSMVLILSFMSALVFAVKPTCVECWNYCQFECSGSPELVVWPFGSKVHCTNSKWPCGSDWWSPWCDD